MKFLSIFSVLLLASVALTAPTSKPSDDDSVLEIDESFFDEQLVVYRAQHEIVKIVVPLNSLNFDEEEEEDDDDGDVFVFFVEADIKENGEKIDQGLYVLKDGKATKLLENGRDAAADNGNDKAVYLAAKDGIYVYNAKENKAEKYGLTDDIIAIEKENGTDVIYIVTSDHHVYKVNDECKQKTKIDQIANAQEIVLDYSNNLYYFGSDKKPYVYDGSNIKKIEGVPENPSYIKLIKPPIFIEDGVPLIADNKVYIIYVNGSSEYADIDLKTYPSAYGPEAALIQYYAYNKKIYEYNIIVLVLSDLLEELKKFLAEEKDAIGTMATRSRQELVAKAY